MTETEKIEEQLKVLDIVYVAGDPKQTFVNVLLAIKELGDKKVYIENLN